MKIRLASLFVAALLVLSACGPITRVGYNYIPPQDVEGKKCVAKCNVQKQKCEQKAESDYQKCLDNKKSEYCRKFSCMNNYHECFYLCDGDIEKYTYQTDIWGNRLD